MVNAIWNRKGPRRALIAGACGGVGEALAHLLAEEGWELALAGDNETELYRVAGVVRARHDVEVVVARADLARAEGVEALARRLEERDFRPDVFIHAIETHLAGKALKTPRADQLRVIDRDVRAAADLALRLLPHMRAQGAGGVLFVASPGAFLPGPGRAVAHAGGAWMASFGEALAEEMRDEGVSIAVLCRGPVGQGRRRAATGLARLLPASRPEVVARAGWQGFKEGRVIILPGVLSRMLALIARFLPRFVSRRLVAWLSGV